MGKVLEWQENGLFFTVELSEKQARILNLSCHPYCERSLTEKQKEQCAMVQLQISGKDHPAHHGSKHIGTDPGTRLVCTDYQEQRTDAGLLLEFTLENEGVQVISSYQFYKGIRAVRCWNTVKNATSEPLELEAISSVMLMGISRGGETEWNRHSSLYVPYNSWAGELQWRCYPVNDLGLVNVAGQSRYQDQQNPHNYSFHRIARRNTGTWSTSETLPIGCLENTETKEFLLWQIEHNGSWNWELSDAEGLLYLYAAGPDERENQWHKSLLPGEHFVSVPGSIIFSTSSFSNVLSELTQYRRAVRIPRKTQKELPVIFNDYMNCLNGDPTTKRLLPLIDAAAKAGCEIFCIDAGWYGDGDWWNSVGEWLPSSARFPNGISEPIKRIQKKGMVAGLWLEIEVMGICCPLADQLPDDWFFMRHGKRVIDHGRYQLDFRNPQVRSHANSIIDRLVKEYGVGYFKMDYNIDAGQGTELLCDSVGDGLLSHNRAYLAWIQSVQLRYPHLILESCASGGMRMDGATLACYDVQSISDQTDYHKLATIAAASPSAMLPEQALTWSYPVIDGDEEETVCNMVNAMLLRLCQSGHLAKLSPERFALVEEGIKTYKTYRNYIRDALPIWPLGVPDFNSPWAALGLRLPDRLLLAVWRLSGENNTKEICLPSYAQKDVTIQCLYPQKMPVDFTWDSEQGQLKITLAHQNQARIFEIMFTGGKPNAL